MKTVTLILVVLTFTSAMATKYKSQTSRYRSWNSRMYPVWRNGDPRFRDCWSGGEVTFDIRNDAPTLTGAKATFNVGLHFPQNQTVLPDGQVVWARNCTINGTQYQEGQAVYPDQGADLSGVFPDGSPIIRVRNRKPLYVFVWKTWGRYWQVADGPSTSLTIDTDNVPLGSYNMEVVIYHCRGKDKFVPLGYASTVFTITDQIPFSISLSQINDINQDDQNFIQNRAIAFGISLHDPSQYLSGSDITFNWDFGDNTGTLISRELTVTHTYLSPGTYRPQVVLMASIPNGCADPTAAVPIDASTAPAVVVVMASTPAANSPAPAQEGEGTAVDVPASEATLADDLALAASLQPAGDVAAVTAASVAPVAEDEAASPAAEDPAVALDAATAAPATPATEVPTVAAVDATGEVAETAEDNVPVIDAAASAAPVVEGEETAVVDLEDSVLPEAPVATFAPAAGGAAVQDTVATAAAAVATEAAQTEAAQTEAAQTEAAQTEAEDQAATQAPAVEEAVAAEPAADPEAETVETENVAPTDAEQPAVSEAAAAPVEGELEAEVEDAAATEAAQVALVLAKRQAPELVAGCMVYRYGSRATSVDIIQGIESAEIVQVANVVSLTNEVEQNAVDLTITCQGSLPSEVCTVISDADCVTPMETVCNAAVPSPDCQLVLRQFFNDSGVFCINVSLTNDVSLAVASARVSVTVGDNGSGAGTVATVLGVMVLACVASSMALMYRRYKQYQPLREDHVINGMGSSTATSVPLLLWNLLSRQSPGESRPLLQSRVV